MLSGGKKRTTIDYAGDGATAVSGADLILNFDFQNGPDSIVERDSTNVQSRSLPFNAEGLGIS